MNNLCIAIIVSNNDYHCRSFLHFHELNPKLFKCVTDIDAAKLHGIKKDTPVIIINSKRNLRPDFLEFVHHRFTSVRYIES